MNTTKNYLIQRLLLNKKANKQNGFTLIELMVVIAIVGVLSAVGLPELLKAQDSAKDSVAQQQALAAAKACSMDILTGGTSYSTALTAKKWGTVTGTCVTTIVEGATSPVPSTIIGTGPNFKTTVTVTEGIPSKPVKTTA